MTGATQAYEKNSAFIQQQLVRQKELHAANLETYRSAREHYLGVVEQAVAHLREHGLPATAKAAADEVATRVAKARQAPGFVLSRVHAAFEALLARGREAVEGARPAAARAVESARPALDAALQRARPAVEAAYGRYRSLHDAVVASPGYARAYGLAGSLLRSAQANPIFLRSRDALYPYLKPYAEPALQRAAPYIAAAQKHVAPAGAEGAAAPADAPAPAPVAAASS